MAQSRIKEARCTRCNMLLFKISNIQCFADIDVECGSCKHGMHLTFSTEKGADSNFVRDYED